MVHDVETDGFDAHKVFLARQGRAHISASREAVYHAVPGSWNRGQHEDSPRSQPSIYPTNLQPDSVLVRLGCHAEVDRDGIVGVRAGGRSETHRLSRIWHRRPSPEHLGA